MFNKYHEWLIDTMNANNVKAQRYFGELADPEKGNFDKGSLPLVYVDFVGDDFPNAKDIDIKFSLYIVHMSYSKNKATRTNMQNEIHDLLQNIYKAFTRQSVYGSNPINIGKLQKIFDSTAASGYLTVYTKDITITIKNPILMGEI